MDQRLARLEARLDEVVATLQRVEARLTALEVTPAEAPSTRVEIPDDQLAAPVPRPDLVHVLTQLGRSTLVLGGAFLIRAVTEAGALATGAGAALGLSYAAVWLLLADRAARRYDRVAAAFSGVTGLAIAFPLLWEATSRFRILTPGIAAAALTLLAVTAVVIAWRTELEVLAWAAVVGTLAVTVPLLVVTHRVVEFGAVLLAIGVATLWLAYARRWHGVRWPAAIVADLMVLHATTVASRPGGPVASYNDLTASAAIALAVVLLVAYLGSFSARILSRRRNVTAFEALQSLAALAIGLGGAWRVVTAAGKSPVPLGAGALVLAAGAYAVAFAFVERRDGRGLSFQFFASIALLLVIAGGFVALPPAGAAVLWSVLGVAAAMLAARHQRATLRSHAAVYLVAAAVGSGLLAVGLDGLVASVTAAWHPLTRTAVVTLLAAVVAYPFLTTGYGTAPPRWFHRLPALAAAALAIVGAVGLGVTALAPALGSSPLAIDPGVLAAARSSLLAAAALVLAMVGRRERCLELGWLVYPLLLGAGFKLLFEDLARGRALTLFPALACYGVALILAPRLLRRSRRPA